MSSIVPSRSSASPSILLDEYETDADIFQYSMYGHIKQLAEAEKAGIEAAGGKADIFQYVDAGAPLSPWNF